MHLVKDKLLKKKGKPFMQLFCLIFNFKLFQEFLYLGCQMLDIINQNQAFFNYHLKP
jgi:hypothetical protein